MVAVALLIPASGSGSRFSKQLKKQYHEIADGVTIIESTIKNLLNSYDFNEVVVAINKEDEPIIADKLRQLVGSKLKLCYGGETRFDTVHNMLQVSTSEYVATHDAVRPFVEKSVVKSTIDKAIKNGNAVCGTFSSDTTYLAGKDSDNNFIVKEHLNRNEIFLVQTPQVFNRQELLNLIAKLPKDYSPTDEASIFFHFEKPVYLTESTRSNIKITYPEDLDYAKFLYSLHNK